MNKSYSRSSEPSPTYPFRNSGNVTTSSPLSINLDAGDYAKYMPFTNCKVYNKSAVDIYIYPNQDATRKILVASGTETTLSPEDVPAWRSAFLYTLSGTASANQIEVLFWREGVSADSVAQKVHDKLFKPRSEAV